MPRRSTSTPQIVDPLAEEAPTAALTAPATVAPPPVAPAPLARPKPEHELSPDELRIRQLEDALARERGAKDPEPELQAPAVPGAAGNILIHFLEDGLTLLGQVWYRGQELEFEPDGGAYADTCDRTGWTPLSLRDDDFAQVQRWGKVFFRSGPWPGKPLTEVAKVAFDTPGAAKPTEAELERAAAVEAGRRRAAPRLPVR